MADNRTVKVTLRAEVASYVAQMMRGQQATEGLGAAASAAGSDIERAMTQAEKAASASSQSFTRWGQITKRTFAGLALAAGGYGAALLVQGVQANSFAEQNQIALTTMLGDAKAAKNALDEVYGLATETPFQFPQLTDQYKNFIAAQLPLEKIIPLMRSYSSAVAALGGSGDKLMIVSDALQDMVTRGKAQGDQLNRLTEQGIPAWHMLAEAMGMTVAEVEKQASAGAISALDAVDILTAGMQSKFGGMLEEMGDSYARWQDRVSSAQRRTAEQLAAPIQEVGKEVMRSLTEMFNESTAALSGADWDPILDPLMRLPESIDRIAARITAGGVQDVIEGVGEGLELAAAAGELVINVALPLVDVLGVAARAGMPLVDVVTGLLDIFNELPAPVQAGIAALALIRTLNGPYTTLIKTTTGFVTTTRAAMAEQMAYQRVLHQGSVLNGTASASVSRLSLAWGAAKTSAMGFGTAVRGAGSALLGAFGGPVGLAVTGALTAITVATSVWTDAQQRSEQAAREQEESIDAVTSALDRNTGAFTENARALIAKQLQDKGLPDLLERAGIGLDEFTDGLYGNEAAQDAFRQKLIETAATPEIFRSLEFAGKHAKDSAEAVQMLADTITYVHTPEDMEKFFTDGLGALEPSVWGAVFALGIFDDQVTNNDASLQSLREQAALTGESVNIDGTVTVDTSQAQSALQSLRDAATKALDSFISTKPITRRTGGGGGGGGGRSGDSPQVKALKAEQAEIKKRTAAEKKAASEYEKVMRKRAQEAEKTAREAERAAQDAASAEEAALDKAERAVDAYVAAQRQRAAIQRTLDAEHDPVRRAALERALADAISHESAMLKAKTAAEREAAAASTASREAQERAAESTKASTDAQVGLEQAIERSAKVQETAAQQMEKVAEQLAKATEKSAGRAGGAMSSAAGEAKESLRQWMDRMKEQIRAQSEWADNMAWLAGNASSGVVSEFMSMGADGAYLLAELRRNGGKELDELERIFGDTATNGKLDLIEQATILNDIYPALVQKFGRKAADELRTSIANGSTDAKSVLDKLKVSYDGKKWTVNLDASTTAAINKVGSIVSYINRQKPTIKVKLEGGALKIGNRMVYPGMSDGGPVEGPGPKGKDSQVRVLAPGEHVLTADDVDAMGGQQAVTDFRRSLHTAPPDLSRATAPTGGGGRSTVIYQTVHYPVAEPSSKAAIRAARQEAG